MLPCTSNFRCLTSNCSHLWTQIAKQLCSLTEKAKYIRNMWTQIERNLLYEMVSSFTEKNVSGLRQMCSNTLTTKQYQHINHTQSMIFFSHNSRIFHFLLIKIRAQSNCKHMKKIRGWPNLPLNLSGRAVEPRRSLQAHERKEYVVSLFPHRWRPQHLEM
jgi:hypothetical protein